MCLTAHWFGKFALQLPDTSWLMNGKTGKGLDITHSCERTRAITFPENLRRQSHHHIPATHPGPSARMGYATQPLIWPYCQNDDALSGMSCWALCRI